MSVAIRDSLKIGNNSVLGMESVITKNVPTNITVFRNPAKLIKKN